MNANDSNPAAPEHSLFHSPGDMAKTIFTNAPRLRRMLMRWRDAICPLEPLVQAVPKEASLLDIGCGGGLLPLYLLSRQQVKGVVGIDASIEAIDVARAGWEKLSPLMQSNATAEFLAVQHPSDWPRGPFEAVSMIDLMHHIPPSEQQAFFLAATERLNSGGVLVYKDMAIHPRWRALANRMHDLLLARQWIHYCPIQKIEQWAEEAGLERVRFESSLCR